MKNLVKKSLLLTALGISAHFSAPQLSQAAGKNLIVCRWNDNDDSVTIREDAGGQLVALFSMLDHGTIAYSVRLQPTPNFEIGAGTTYRGAQFSLSLSPGSYDGRQHYLSFFSIPSMNIHNEKISCKKLD